MQQAKRWRQPASWQIVLARWLLAVAVVVSLNPSSSSASGSVARAQDRGQDDLIVERTVADEDIQPEHAIADDGAPNLPSQEGPAPDDEMPAPTEAASAEAADHTAAACPVELGAAKVASFSRDDRLVMTYYYYWYDEASLEDPALTQRPPPDPPLDWRSVSWHERQLADMASAGIDVALAVYWGDTAPWSVEALEPMVEARERLLAAGLRAPAIGLFFDTNMYAMILPERPGLSDLTTNDGLDMLAHQIGVFLDHVPPCHRARVDGRPLAFFWRADTEDGDQFTFDDRTFDGLTDRIAAEHGERLHLVVERSWQEAAREANVELGAMDVYRWGAALNGPRFEGRTVAVGPGYDDTRIDGRPGYTRERTEGGTYSRDLRQAVMSGTTWLLLETWNELWEGTAIAETEQTGRTYLGITARYSALFHQLGKERARDAWFDLGSSQNAYLRRLADAPIEQGMPAEGNGHWGARPFREDEDGTGYFHFALDRRLNLTEPRPLTVVVEYFDEGEGSFVLEYDSLDQEAPPEDSLVLEPEGLDQDVSGDGSHLSEPEDLDQEASDDGSLTSEHDSLGLSVAGDSAYRPTERVYFENTRTWRTHRFELTDASLKHRQYDGGGDFRLHDTPGPDERLHLFGRVTVTAEPASRPVPFGPEGLAFVDPGPREGITLRWSEAEPTASYLVIVQPFDLEDDTDQHGFTTDDRRRCVGEAQVGPGQGARGPIRQATCELRLARDLGDGVYRWRVQALDAGGSLQGHSSDWGYFVVAHR